MADISGSGSDDDQTSDASTANVRLGGSPAAAPPRPELGAERIKCPAPSSKLQFCGFSAGRSQSRRDHHLFGARAPAIGAFRTSTVDAVRDGPARPSAFGPLIEETRNFAMTLFGIRGYCDARRKRGESQKRSFSNSRLWPEVDLSQLVQLIGVIVEGIVQGFGKITGDFSLGLLIAFDRLFASVEPSISNIVEVLFAGAFGGPHPQANALSL